MNREVLQFSGGKDSLACLYLLRHKWEWERLVVCWQNTGDAFPETLEQMERIRAMVPNFFEVKSDVRTDVMRHGAPTDVLPIKHCGVGKATTDERGMKLQSWYECCARSSWIPMQQAMIDIGATVIYRGQRDLDEYKAPLTDGDVIDGVTYRFPIQGWSEAQVDDYLASQGVALPSHYEFTKKSLDCMHCTAYLDEKLPQLQYLKRFHPAQFAEVRSTLQSIKVAVEKAARPLELACAL